MQFKQAEAGPLTEYQLNQTMVIPYRDIIHPDGLVRIEYFHDLDVERPSAFQRFRARLAVFYQEAQKGIWKTMVTETMTSAELAARMYEIKIMNPMERFAKGTDTRQWFSASTDECEQIFCYGYAGLNLNLVLNCHINERKNEVSGEILRGPFAPGRLATRGALSAMWQEQYHIYTLRDQDGQRQYQLQTQNDGQWASTTQIDAPNPCYPHYESLWVNWVGERPPIHTMVYGDTGTGKSTFACSFPKPMLVFMFDGMGKDLPFWKHYQ